MKTKSISFTFLFSTIAICAFAQSAFAGQGPPPGPGANRFDYEKNYYALDPATGRGPSRRGGGSSPANYSSNVAPGAVSNISSFAKDFISSPMPASAPLASASVSSKVRVPQSFSKLLNPGNTQSPLVAASAPAGAFGSPIAQKLEPMKAVSRSVKLAGTPKLLNSRPSQAAHRPTTVIASSAQPFRVPTIKHVTTGYSAEQHLPTAVGSGASTSAEVRGVLVPKR